MHDTQHIVYASAPSDSALTQLFAKERAELRKERIELHCSDFKTLESRVQILQILQILQNTTLQVHYSASAVAFHYTTYNA